MTQQYRPDDDVSGDLGGKYLNKAEFENGNGIRFTITSVEKTTFEAKNGKPAEVKWVVTFVGDRSLPLNRTNLNLLAKWFGTRSSAWAGKEITVYRDESVMMAGRLTGGWRVRRPQPHDVPSVVPDTELEPGDVPF